MKHLPLFSSVLLGLLLTACSLLGINTDRKTPRKPGSYPKFTAQDSINGAYHANRSNTDVTHYDISIDIDPDERYLKGKVVMSLTALEPLTRFQIDLYENMEVNSITSTSGSLTYVREKAAIIVTLDQEVSEGSEFMLSVDYQGKPTKAKRPPWNGGFVWKKDDDKSPFIGVACELKGASLWWPVKDHLMDEPDSVDLHFTVPKNLECVSNGQLISNEVADGKRTVHWHVSYPINTYNVTVYVGDYTHFQEEYQGTEAKYMLDYYVLPAHIEAAKRQFKQTNLALDAYEEFFGPYPWPRDGFKLIESPYAGMEHQTAIAYGEKFRNQGFGNYDYIIIHEAAHEWWGNSVTATDFSEAWIHEGFATYSEALVEEKFQGSAAYFRYIKTIAYFIKNKRPVIGPRDVKYWDYHDNDLYMKGAMFLHTLRMVLGNDELFFDILKSYYQQHAHGWATTEDFIALVNEKTGSDYRYLFDQYLYERACPELESTFRKNAATDKVELFYRWTNTRPDFQMPITLHVNGETKVKLVPTLETQMVELDAERISMNRDQLYIRTVENEKLIKGFQTR